MAPDTTRPTYETIRSLQRELAEARAHAKEARQALTSIRAAVDADLGLERATNEAPVEVNTELYRTKILEAIAALKSRTSLTPLTSPIVRGVLVDDGEPTNVLKGGHLYLAGDLLFRSDSDDVDNSNWQPVKLCPASEFGVPGEIISAAVCPECDGQRTDKTGWCYDCGEHTFDIVKAADDDEPSTPAEPAQKLVPLPDGAIVGVPIKSWSTEFDYIWYKEQRYLPKDPALYGVPAERVREQYAELYDKYTVADMEVERLRKELTDWQANYEAEREEKIRLRKAIDTHKATVRGATDSIETSEGDEVLWSALTPPTAASGEKQQLPPTETFYKKAMETSAEIKGGSAPAAESEWDDELEQFREAVRREKQQWVASYEFVSARLAACEERCKELEGILSQAALHIANGNALSSRGQSVAEYDKAFVLVAPFALLAPKGEAAG